MSEPVTSPPPPEPSDHIIKTPVEPGKTVPLPTDVEASTIVLFDGLWHDVTIRIRGDEIIEKLVGPGDLMGFAVERGVARLVSFAERQKSEFRG